VPGELGENAMRSNLRRCRLPISHLILVVDGRTESAVERSL